MVGSAAVRWTLSAVFALTAAYYLYGLARREERRHGPRLVVDDALHVVMGAAMITMLWSWGLAVPVMVYVLVFTSAALWFVARGLFPPTPVVVSIGDPPVAAGHHGFRGLAWYHAAMMGSMVWMAVVMSVTMSTLPVYSPGSTSTSTSSMPGMDMSMPGMDMGSTGSTGGSMVVPVASWIRIPSLLLAACFVAAAVWLLTAGIRGRPARHSVAAGAVSGVMAAGMALAFVEMV